MPLEGVSAVSASQPAAQPAAKATDTPAGKTTAPGVSEPKKETQNENPFAGTKHKLKVKGQERELPYEEVIARAQKAEAAEMTFQEAAQLRKEFDTLMQGIAKGDEKSWNFLRNNVPAPTFKQIVNKYAYEFMEYDSLPDDEKRRMELDERERALNAEQTRRQQEAEAAKWQEDVQGSGTAIQEMIDSFSERTGKTPSTPELYRITERMLAHLQKYNTLPEIDKLYQIAQHEVERDTHDTLRKKASDPKALLEFMPPEIRDVLRKAIMDQESGARPKRYDRDAEEVTASAPRRKSGEPVGIDDAFKRMEKRLKGQRR